MEEAEITIKIPLDLKKRLEKANIDVNQAVSNVIQKLIEDNSILDDISEIHLERKDPSAIRASDIPPGSFIRVPSLNIEQFEAIVDDTSWEYLDGNLIHHSPESNLHNAMLNFINYRALSVLDPARYIIRTSRVALAINQDRPQPDLMVFEKDAFRKARRADGSESEIVESTPVLVIEIVSRSSKDVDDRKVEKYLSKGVKEYWRISCHEKPLLVRVCTLKRGAYEEISYTTGEVRARTLPDFAITFDELGNPDSSR